MGCFSRVFSGISPAIFRQSSGCRQTSGWSSRRSRGPRHRRLELRKALHCATARSSPSGASDTQPGALYPSPRLLAAEIGVADSLVPPQRRRLARGVEDGGKISGMIFSPNGMRIVTWSEDKSVRGWDVATGAEIRLFTSIETDPGATGFSTEN